MIGTEAATALYAYAAVGPVSGLEGALPDELDLIGDDMVSIVVERVSLDEFGADALRENLNDRRWLETKARRHEEVVQSLLGRATVVPLRFGSIHHDGSAVEAFLDERRGEFRRTLAELAGLVEMGVKAWLTESRAGAPEATASSGRGYLEARRRARDDAAAAAARRADELTRAHRRLLEACEAGVLNRPQASELSGRDEAMVLNGAYLVRAGDDRLGEEVGRLNAESEDLQFELTGPWAPYNFVEIDA